MNPSDDSLATGYVRVDTDVTCVVTRFHVRSVWALLRFYRFFLSVQRNSREVRGLLKSVFLIENWHTCYTLSLWSDDNAILSFNTKVRAHVHAANSAFRDVSISPDGADIWSAQFRLLALSAYNLRWHDVSIDATFRDRISVRIPDNARHPGLHEPVGSRGRSSHVI
jgi:hypothetical protein